MPSDKSELISVWELSVRATHHFLSGKHIDHIKSILEQMDLSDLSITLYKSNEGNMLGFIGTSEEKIKMLFVHPDHFRSGIGASLIKAVMKDPTIREVIVNEQNPNAIKFYQSFGFKITGRSNRDEQGNPYPIVFMFK